MLVWNRYCDVEEGNVTIITQCSKYGLHKVVFTTQYFYSLVDLIIMIYIYNYKLIFYLYISKIKRTHNPLSKLFWLNGQDYYFFDLKTWKKSNKYWFYAYLTLKKNTYFKHTSLIKKSKYIF